MKSLGRIKSVLLANSRRHGRSKHKLLKLNIWATQCKYVVLWTEKNKKI